MLRSAATLVTCNITCNTHLVTGALMPVLVSRYQLLSHRNGLSQGLLSPDASFRVQSGRATQGNLEITADCRHVGKKRETTPAPKQKTQSAGGCTNEAPRGGANQHTTPKRERRGPVTKQARSQTPPALKHHCV